MKRIIAGTDVLYREVRHVKGTEFDVADRPDPAAKPVQVDPTTAAAWERQGWLGEPLPIAAAEDVAAAAAVVETVVPTPVETPPAPRATRGR